VTAAKAVPGLKLRQATADDARTLNDMIGAFAAYERLPNNSTAESLRAELDRPDRVVEAVLAFLDGQPIGFAVFFQTYSTFIAKRGLYLEDIYVREEFRNRGIASAILRYIARLAVERDYGRVEFTVLLWNTVAIEFFEKQGATPTSAWTTYRLSGEWLQKLARESTQHVAT
jgi:GNAT superfamily N-acetyltransferase